MDYHHGTDDQTDGQRTDDDNGTDHGTDGQRTDDGGTNNLTDGRTEDDDGGDGTDGQRTDDRLYRSEPSSRRAVNHEYSGWLSRESPGWFPGR